jgi:GNAT superfamily N-acetyltransferase
MVLVRRWARADIDYVLDSITGEDWGQSRRDVERCWQLEPDGCFLAEVSGRPIGHVFSVSYGKAGWIGFLIVNPESRGRGVGEALMRRAIDYLSRRGVEAVRLEAAERAVPLYRRLGFTGEFDSLRFSRQIGRKERETLSRSSEFEASPVAEADLKDLAAFDSEYFGVNRLKVLKGLCADEPKHCFFARKSGEIVGYVFGRNALFDFWLGPWVCRDARVAEGLFRVCIGAVEKDEIQVRLGMPVLNGDGVGLMKKLEFQLVGRSVRMVWGKPDYKGNIAGVYGIGGPEKG